MKPQVKGSVTSLNYKQKLEQFNSTVKYKNEMDFLTKLMDIQKNETVLDYGCGIGTMVEELTFKYPDSHIFGYDKYQYIEDQDWFKNSFHFPMDKVYFMHSIDHIENIMSALFYLKENLKATSKVYVLTPNRFWLENMRNEEYEPDETVIRHHSPRELIQLFEDSGFIIDYLGQMGKEKNGFNERIFLKASK